MDKVILRKLIALCLLTVSCSAAASITYSYIGLPYNYFRDSPLIPGAFDSSMKVTGSIELADPVGPNASPDWNDVLRFSISNGRYTLTESSPSLHPQTPGFENFINADSSGNIVHWRFTAVADVLEASSLLEILITTQSDIFLDTSDVVDRAIAQYEYGGHGGLPNDFALGFWSLTTSPVPIPSPAMLLMVALGFIGTRLTNQNKMFS